VSREAADLGVRAATMLDALWSRGDGAPLEAMVADGFTHTLVAGTGETDLAGWLVEVARFREAFSPIEVLLHRVLVEDACVALHYTLLGTHSGPFFDVPPSGRTGSLEVMSFLHFDGAARLVRQTTVTDFLTLRRSLAEASP
jgi:predicted ester cyclase